MMVPGIDALFAIEREINGLSADERLRLRAERSRSMSGNSEECCCTKWSGAGVTMPA